MKNLKSFSQYIVESKKEISVGWAVGTPPSIAYEPLFEATKKASGNSSYKIYVSPSKDGLLEHTTKVKYLRKMFPRHARNIVLDESAKSPLSLMVSLYDQGYNNISFVTESSRVTEHKALLEKYNGHKSRHGFYRFESINVLSAGSSMLSESNVVRSAEANDFQSFMTEMPLGFTETKELFNDLRKKMGLGESHSFRKHIQFEPISEEREAYVSGDLYAVGEEVLVKESSMPAHIIYLGTNHVVLMDENKNKFKKWIHQLEKLNESEVDRVKDRAEREKEKAEDQLERDLERAKELDDREAELEKEQEQERLEREKEEREKRQQRQESIRYILKAIQEK